MFYFGLFSFVLLAAVCFGSDRFEGLNELKKSDAVFFNSFFKDIANLEKDNLFFGQNKALVLETPDLKIMEDNSVLGISPTRVLTPKTLGAIFGESAQNKKEIVEYSVEPGDTLESIAQNFDISLNTLLWANELTKNSTIKVGQTLVIPPVSGVIYIVKSGDTISEISKTYKAKIDDIVAFNDLSNENDIFIGDILIIPNGVIPKKPSPLYVQTKLADNFFIFPTEGRITQGLHWYNAIDIANKCGTPIYAAASGTVLRVKYGWNFGGGNYLTILHSNGVTTYYGHPMTIFVKPGDRVDVGDRIALIGGNPGMPGAGLSTGCHLHFGVIGAKNPLAKYGLGAQIRYTK